LIRQGNLKVYRDIVHRIYPSQVYAGDIPNVLLTARNCHMYERDITAMTMYLRA